MTAIDFFSRYLFAYPLIEATATNVAKVKIDIMTKPFILTDNSYYGQRVRIYIDHHSQNNSNFGHNTQMRHYEAPANNWQA